MLDFPNPTFGINNVFNSTTKALYLSFIYYSGGIFVKGLLRGKSIYIDKPGMKEPKRKMKESDPINKCGVPSILYGNRVEMFVCLLFAEIPLFQSF